MDTTPNATIFVWLQSGLGTGSLPSITAASQLDTRDAAPISGGRQDQQSKQQVVCGNLNTQASACPNRSRIRLTGLLAC
jgi:hypothetical protein